MHKLKNASGKYAISNVSCRWFDYLLLHYKFGAWDLFVLLTAFIIWPGLSKALRAFFDWSKRLSFAKIKFSAFVSSSHVFQSPNLTVSGLTMINDSCQMVANCWRSARFSRTRSESFWGPKNMFKSSLSSIFIMDADFAGLVEKVNNFSKDGIFASDRHWLLEAVCVSHPTNSDV